MQGCGAFGGNKTLLGVLQVLGALIAQIDGFVYHSFDEESRIVIEKVLPFLFLRYESNSLVVNDSIVASRISYSFLVLY